MTKLEGLLIARARAKCNWSQLGLCKGICTVSYLSKIEQGKADPSREVLRLLFERLGILWHTAEQLPFGQEHFDTLYETLFAMENLREAFAPLLPHREHYLASPFLIDYVLLAQACNLETDYDLAPFLPALSSRQYALYLYLTDDFDSLLLHGRNAFYLCQVGCDAYRKGAYDHAVQLLTRAYSAASEEGLVHVMLLCKANLGNCYSDSHQPEQMKEQYTVALRLAKAVGDTQTAASIHYNLAATALEAGQIDEAYALLRAHPQDTLLYWHKLAICHEKRGQRDAALECLRRAETAPNDWPEQTALLLRMCQIVRLRLMTENYLKDERYGAALQAVFAELRKNMPMGFARFHLPEMLKYLKANRQWRQACELIEEFS